MEKAQRRLQKLEAFKRISKPRIEKAVKSIEVLGNCASNNYYYTNQDAQDICTVLDLEVQKLRVLFKIETPQLTQQRPSNEPHVSNETIDQHSLSWICWALERLQTGDYPAAKDMLRTAIKSITKGPVNDH